MISRKFLTTNLSLKNGQRKTRMKNKKIELKALPPHLKYVFLAGNSQRPVIINSSLSKEEEKKLVKILKENIEAIGSPLLLSNCRKSKP